MLQYTPSPSPDREQEIGYSQRAHKTTRAQASMPAAKKNCWCCHALGAMGLASVPARCIRPRARPAPALAVASYIHIHYRSGHGRRAARGLPSYIHIHFRSGPAPARGPAPAFAVPSYIHIHFRSGPAPAPGPRRRSPCLHTYIYIHFRSCLHTYIYTSGQAPGARGL